MMSRLKHSLQVMLYRASSHSLPGYPMASECRFQVTVRNVFRGQMDSHSKSGIVSVQMWKMVGHPSTMDRSITSDAYSAMPILEPRKFLPNQTGEELIPYWQVLLLVGTRMLILGKD